MTNDYYEDMTRTELRDLLCRVENRLFGIPHEETREDCAALEDDEIVDIITGYLNKSAYAEKLADVQQLWETETVRDASQDRKVSESAAVVHCLDGLEQVLVD